MTIPPLDPFSEVLDERRRWKPEWYSWLTEISEAIPAVASGGVGVMAVPTTDNAIVRWDGTTGTLIQNSLASISDDGTLSLYGSVDAITLSTIPGTYSVAGYSFNDLASFYLAGFGDGNFHIAFAIQGATSASATGSFTGLQVNQYGTGRSTNGYVTGGLLQSITAPGSTSDSGRYFGINSQVVIGTGLTVSQACSIEVDVIVNSTVGWKEGIRIADNSSAGASVISAAINAVKFSGKYGFDYLIHVGEDDGGGDWDDLFPVRTGGTLFYAKNDTIALANGIDLTDCGGGFSDSAFKSPGFSVNGVGKVTASAGADPHTFSTLNATGAAFKISNFGTGQTFLQIDNDTINRQTLVLFQNDGVDAYYVGKDSSGEFVVYDSINAKYLMKLNNTSTATQTALQLYDVDNNTFERVTVGAADSGGVGFKVLRIPN